MSFFFICCSLLVAVVLSKSTKRVTLYNNGESTNGVDAVIDESMFETNFTDAIGDFLLVKKHHLAPGVAKVGAVYTGAGLRVEKFDDIRENDRLYVVPEGILFVWPFVKLGYRTVVDGRQLNYDRPVVLESVSDYPRVFRIHDFFTAEEADTLIKGVEAITDERYKLKRSTTGVETDPAKAVLSTTRTSENAFDTNTPTAVELKHRMFKLLRIAEYNEDWADGLQLLRYKPKMAYIPHHDWFDAGADAKWNFDPATGGSNRFATVFLYLNDVEEGGQTVFPMAETPPNIEGVERNEMPIALAKELFNETDWEYDMIAKCYSKLAVKPKKTQSVLFYSQLGDGKMDDASLHGACPVLKGIKWGANLWVWNDVRHGLKATNIPGHVAQEAPQFTKIIAIFVNNYPSAVTLRWETTDMQVITPNGQASFNTFESHRWNVVKDGEMVWTHTIKLADGTSQRLAFGGPPPSQHPPSDEL